MANNLSLEKPSIMSHLRRWFLTGLLVTGPIVVTVYIVWLVVDIIDNQVVRLLPENLNPDQYLLDLPGVGLVIAVITIIMIGALTTNFIGVSLIRFGESIVSRVPVARSVYGAIKQIMETIMASQSDAFREVVLIEYPRRGIWAIGFVTGGTRGEVQNLSSENLINVFVPTTPNPTSGFLLFFPREDAITLDMGVEEAVKMVVSGGIVTPDDPRARRSKTSLASRTTKKTARKSTRKKAGRKTARKKVARKKTARAAATKRVARKVSRKKTVRKKAARKAVRKKTARKAVRKKAARKVSRKKTVRKKAARKATRKKVARKTVRKKTVRKKAARKATRKKAAHKTARKKTARRAAAKKSPRRR